MATFEELKELATKTSTASVADINALGGARHEFYMQGVRCQSPGKKLFGEAVTLRSLPVRPDLMETLDDEAGGVRANYPFERALELSANGKILVVDSSGYHDAAVGGGNRFLRLHSLRCGGLVTDGSVRDQDDLQSFDFPLFCTSFTALPATGLKLIGADLNVPVSCGKVLVRPGDFLLGDAAGVVVLPRDDAEEILQKAVMDEELNVFLQRLILEEGLSPGDVYPPPPAIMERFAQEKGVSVEELA